jgi:hypothetical protein
LFDCGSDLVIAKGVSFVPCANITSSVQFYVWAKAPVPFLGFLRPLVLRRFFKFSQHLPLMPMRNEMFWTRLLLLRTAGFHNELSCTEDAHTDDGYSVTVCRRPGTFFMIFFL